MAMSSRPRLLFLGQMLPYPPDAGVSIRTFNVLRLLAREFEITALCFYRRALHPTPERREASTAALSRIARIEVFPIPEEYNRARLGWDHTRSVLMGRPYTVFAYRSSAFHHRLRHLLATQPFDIAHIDSLDLSDYAGAVAHIPTVCVHHNVESRLLRSRALTSRPPFSTYLGLQARHTEREERRWCPRFSVNVSVSDDDAEALRQIAPTAQFAVVPNGVDTREFQPGAEDVANNLVFVGGHTWAPNREAMDFFCEEVLPIIRASGITPNVSWVGNTTEEAKHRYAQRYGVKLTGYVDDIRPWVHSAACYIVPLRAGGGTRLKILDAWAMGKAVVSTSVGCEGLRARDGENILIRDTPRSFAEAVRSILRDSGLRKRLGAAGRRTAEQFYDWEVIGRDMQGLYERLLRMGPNAASTPRT